MFASTTTDHEYGEEVAEVAPVVFASYVDETRMNVGNESAQVSFIHRRISAPHGFWGKEDDATPSESMVLDHDEGEVEIAPVFTFGFAQPEPVFVQVSLTRHRVSTLTGCLEIGRGCHPGDGNGPRL